MLGWLAWGVSALQSARPYLFVAANVVSLALTLGDVMRGISYLRWLRRPGNRSRSTGYPVSFRRRPNP